MSAAADVLVGRDDELAVAGALLDAGARGRGGVLAATGPAGVGLTAFAEAVDARARAAGHTVVWGVARPRDPSSPWAQVARALGRGTTATAPASRTADVVVAALPDSPVVIIVDDAQHLGEEAAAALDDLAVEARNLPLLVVAVATEPAPSGGACRPPGHRAVRLRDLTREQTATVVRRRRPGASAATARAVHAATGGIPAAVVAECGQPAPGAGPTPPEATHVVTRRLAAVDADAADVLTVLCAFDEPAPHDVVALLGHWDAADVGRLVRTLAAAGLAAEAGAGASVPCGAVRQLLRERLGGEARALQERAWRLVGHRTGRGATGAAPARAPLVRERLVSALDAAAERRLVTIVADAGFGKTTLLSTWAATTPLPVAWLPLTPVHDDAVRLLRALVDALATQVPALDADALVIGAGERGPDAPDEPLQLGRRAANRLAAQVERHLGEPVHLVVDDVHLLTDVEAIALLDGLVRSAPPALHVVLAGRHLDAFSLGRLHAAGVATELSATDLAFQPSEVSALLTPGARRHAEVVHATTGGWPIAVGLLADALSRHADTDIAALVRDLARPGGELFTTLLDDALAAEGPDLVQVLRAATVLPSLPPALAATLGMADADARLAELAHRGLVVERSAGGDVAVRPLVTNVVAASDGLGEWERSSVLRRAAAWLTRAGRLRDALAAHASWADRDALTAFLLRHGHDVTAAGAAREVLSALDAVEITGASELLILRGECYRLIGSWDRALAAFRAAAGEARALPAALAWRIAVIHQHRGEHDLALEVCARGVRGGDSPVDEALLEGWAAALHWVRGDADAARAAAARAHDLALRTDDARALATSHTAMALVAAADGDRDANVAHYGRALEAARAAGDVLQQVRVLLNRSSHHIEEAAYVEALADLDEALDHAERGGFEHLRAIALVNRGEALKRTGRLDEALPSYQHAHAILQRLGSRLVCYVLNELADAHAEQGDVARAVGEVGRALERAEEAGDHQALVQGLCLQARLLADTDPAAAAAAVARARAAGPGVHAATVEVVAGWVALARGDRDAAHAHAGRGRALAGERRDRARAAEASLLSALAEDDVDEQAIAAAEDAWRALDDVASAAFAALLHALVRGDDDAAERQRQRLRELDARGLADRAERLVSAQVPTAPTARPALEVVTLGGFVVVRHGVPVPLASWQSRKARDLLKILVARRGRPATRDALADVLWPGDADPAKLGNRLSVALSILRRTLVGPDASTADAPIVADGATVALDLARCAVDVEGFLAASATALEAYRQRADDAAHALAGAEERYRGDFLEEDLYAEWATSLRDEARATYVEVAMALADVRAEEGEHDAAARLYRRVLDRDAYDEAAHLGLIASLLGAGRHGDARRGYDVYVERMQEMGVEAAPYPSTAATRGSSRAA